MLATSETSQRYDGRLFGPSYNPRIELSALEARLDALCYFITVGLLPNPADDVGSGNEHAEFGFDTGRSA